MFFGPLVDVVHVCHGPIPVQGDREQIQDGGYHVFGLGFVVGGGGRAEPVRSDASSRRCDVLVLVVSAH